MTSMPSTPSPFVFWHDEKVGQGFVRVLGALAIHTRLLTRNASGTLAESVHEVRVSIKRLRALLWFARPALSLAESKRLKSHLRKASHLLAAQRDFVVMRSILEKLSGKIGKSSERATLIRIAHAQDGEQAGNGIPGQSLQKAIAILLTTIEQLERKAKSKPRWPTSSDRLAQAFLAVEKSAKKARHSEVPAKFHDWRKKAKRLLFLLRLTQAISGKHMTQTIDWVDKLQEKLGDYHDSNIARDRLRKGFPGKIPPQIMIHGVKLLEKRMHRLRTKVWKIAQRIKFK